MDFPSSRDPRDSGDAGDGIDDLDLATELAELTAYQERVDSFIDQIAADYASLDLGSPADFVRRSRVALQNAVRVLDTVGPQIEQYRIEHPLKREARVLTTGSEYDLPMMDDAIGRTAVMLTHHIDSPSAPRLMISMNEVNQVVRDRKLAQDARSIAAISMYNSVTLCLQRMTDIDVVASTAEAVALDNLRFGDVDQLIEVARFHPDLARQRHLLEYLRAIDHALDRPFDQLHDVVVDPNNPFITRLELDLATARAARLSAMTDAEFAVAFLHTLPVGPVRDAATLPVIGSMGTTGNLDHQLKVLQLLVHQDPHVTAQRAASYVFGCGTNDDPEAYRWMRDEIAPRMPALGPTPAWLGVFYAQGLMQHSFAEMNTAIILMRNQLGD